MNWLNKLKAFLESPFIVANLRFAIMGISLIVAVSIYACSTRYSKTDIRYEAFDRWTGKTVKFSTSTTKEKETAPPSMMPTLELFTDKLEKMGTLPGQNIGFTKWEPLADAVDSQNHLELFEAWREHTNTYLSRLYRDYPQFFEKYAPQIEKEIQGVKRRLVFRDIWQEIRYYVLLGITTAGSIGIYVLFKRHYRRS